MVSFNFYPFLIDLMLVTRPMRPVPILHQIHYVLMLLSKLHQKLFHLRQLQFLVDFQPKFKGWYLPILIFDDLLKLTWLMYVISSILPSSSWDESLYESSDKVADVSPELAIGMVILEVILLAAELIWLLPLIWFHLSMIPSISRAFSWFLSAFDNDFWLEFSLGIGGDLFDLPDPDLLVEVLEVCTIDSSTLQGFYDLKLW